MVESIVTISDITNKDNENDNYKYELDATNSTRILPVSVTPTQQNTSNSW